jgi:hypothetical protein
MHVGLDGRVSPLHDPCMPTTPIPEARAPRSVSHANATSASCDRAASQLRYTRGPSCTSSAMAGTTAARMTRPTTCCSRHATSCDLQYCTTSKAGRRSRLSMSVLVCCRSTAVWSHGQPLPVWPHGQPLPWWGASCLLKGSQIGLQREPDNRRLSKAHARL